MANYGANARFYAKNCFSAPPYAQLRAPFHTPHGWDSRQCPDKEVTLFQRSLIERFHCIIVTCNNSLVQQTLFHSATFITDHVLVPKNTSS